MSKSFVLNKEVTACGDCPFFHSYLITCFHYSTPHGEPIEDDLDLDENIPDWCPEVSKNA